MTKQDDKVRENRARRAAERQGLALSKSRRRDARSIGYGGYMLADSHNVTVLGATPYEFSATMDDVERFLGITR